VPKPATPLGETGDGEKEGLERPCSPSIRCGSCPTGAQLADNNLAKNQSKGHGSRRPQDQ